MPVICRSGDYGYFLVTRDRLPRLDSLFRESPDVARRLGLLFGEMPIRGDTRVPGARRLLRPAHPRCRAVRRWPTGRMPGSATGWRSTPRSRSRAPGSWCGASNPARIASIGLQLPELLQVDPDEQLLDSIEDENVTRLERWLARLLRRRRST
jgi:potassium/hydrogen antiporter